MPFKIRTKLTGAFLVMLIPLVVLIGINSYNERVLSLVLHKAKDEYREISGLSDIQIAIGKLIMHPNDYLITGDIREKEGFNSTATEIEGYLLNLSDTMSCRQCHDNTHERVKRLYGLEPKSFWADDMVYMKGVMDSLQIIKGKGEKIFKIEKSVGSKEGALLMQEIDATAHKLSIGVKQK
ncbi:MAG: hypothetical protein HY936_09220 [Nitrosomonadales bacterium]|nr:hypothetical protein [Nitrosomonadales bacterium]